MRDYSSGIQIDVNEHDYQRDLIEYRDGFVLTLAKNRRGRLTLHRPSCKAVAYDLRSMNHKRRSGRILFHDNLEDKAKFEAWLKETLRLSWGDLNLSGSCKCM